MKQRSLLFFLLVVFISAISLIGGSGCANIIPPLGGPRDSLPPDLVSVNPRDSVTNFTGKKITFSFNEYVQLDQIQENLLVSPYPKITPTVESKLRTVTVTIRDTLEENTTYAINFGNAIKDVNEGNPLRNFTYIFSTGSYLDSLSVAGKVIIAESGKTDSTLIVVLHTDFRDSAIVKERPRYVTRVNSGGSFVFHNLPEGEFALYVLKDEGGSRRYLSKSQLFAFADSNIKSQQAPQPVTLYAYIAPDDDTTRRPPVVALPKINTTKPGTAPDKRLRIETNLSGDQLDLLDTLKFFFKQAPLKIFDSTKLQFTNEKSEPLTGYRLVEDTARQKITFIYPFVPNTAYKIILDKTVAEDTAGRKLIRNDTIDFRTKKESDYGTVKLRVPALDLSRNPVLQFVDNDKVVFSHVFGNTKEFNSKLFKPALYELRILYDENKNGVWDPGQFFGKRRQPERVQPISRKVEVKPNWDAVVDLELN
jgi:hypothetical protein